jgi:hypothetical protein
MTAEHNIQIPDTTKGQTAMVLVRGIYYALFYKDGKSVRRSLKTSNNKEAVRARNHFYSSLVADGATVYLKRTAQDKIKNKPDLYIYARPPYLLKVNGKVLLESWDRAEVEKARDAFVYGK